MTVLPCPKHTATPCFGYTLFGKASTWQSQCNNSASSTPQGEILSQTHSYRRKNALTGDWVLVSPHRGNRPWSGEASPATAQEKPQHDANCPLCPGTKRANDTYNPDYRGPHVFNNDFSALTAPDSSLEQVVVTAESATATPSFISEDIASGECRVICFDHRHDRTLADFNLEELSHLLGVMQKAYRELSVKYRCVTLFENKGALMGCSQPHPHGQIWAHTHLSSNIATEDRQQLDYFQENGSPLLADYQVWESQQNKRVVFENADWLIVVPYWAAWPYETLLLTKGTQTSLSGLTPSNLETLAEALAVLNRTYDALFDCAFPYSMGWHNAPSDPANSHWRVHAHFYPPLLRSASIKKHMVGYEMLGEPQRDLTVESAAQTLRQLADPIAQQLAACP